MAVIFVPFVHIATAVLCIIELGLTAYVVSFFTAPRTQDSWSPSSLDFMLFNSVWSLLVLVYVGVVPLYFTGLFHRLASVGLLAVTTLFWFAGAIAWAVWVGGPYDCDSSSLCRSTEASVAFGFFAWAAFTVLLVVDAIEAMRERGHHSAATAHVHAKPYPGA